MQLTNLTMDNIDTEHICCAISDKKGETCISSKKAWLKERLNEGLVFKKIDARGKVFIEYIPAEKAWCPIEADNYMHINCFWVSGQFKGQGYANQLLNECIDNAKSKGKEGLTVLSSTKKLPFLSDPAYLKYKGFLVADKSFATYELLYLPFSSEARVPKFKMCSKIGKIEDKGLVLYYTNQCPHTDKYAPIIQNLAKERGQNLKLIKFETTEQAQNSPAPFTTYSFFYNGEFVTNEILSEKKFLSFLDSKGL